MSYESVETVQIKFKNQSEIFSVSTNATVENLNTLLRELLSSEKDYNFFVKSRVVESSLNSVLSEIPSLLETVVEIDYQAAITPKLKKTISIPNVSRVFANEKTLFVSDYQGNLHRGSEFVLNTTTVFEHKITDFALFNNSILLSSIDGDLKILKENGELTELPPVSGISPSIALLDECAVVSSTDGVLTVLTSDFERKTKKENVSLKMIVRYLTDTILMGTNNNEIYKTGLEKKAILLQHFPGSLLNSLAVNPHLNCFLAVFSDSYFLADEKEQRVSSFEKKLFGKSGKFLNEHEFLVAGLFGNIEKFDLRYHGVLDSLSLVSQKIFDMNTFNGTIYFGGDKAVIIYEFF